MREQAPPWPSTVQKPPVGLRGRGNCVGCAPSGAPVRVQGLRGLAGIGTALPGWGYAAAALAGAGLGGALIGYVAADDKPGAYKGAAFAAGLTGVSNGVATWRDDRLLGTVLIVSGLGGMFWSIRGKMKVLRR